MLSRFVPLLATAFLAVLIGAPAAVAEPVLAPFPSLLAFGNVDIHFGGSPRQNVKFVNNSPSETSVGRLSVAGPSASAFVVVNDGCSERSLPAMSGCNVEVGFSPGTSGLKTATLELAASEGTLEVPLSGAGITGTLSASPNSVSFGPIPYTRASHEGEQNETEQVTVTDASAGTSIESVAIAGADASAFSLQYSGCANDLMAPNNTCSVGVRFQPTSPGLKHAVLVLASDASSGVLEIPLQGEGLQGPHLSASSTQALLGNVLLGGQLAQTFTVTNTGDYPLFVQQLFLISGTPLMFPVSTDTCSGEIIAPGSSCDVTVDFEPTTLGQKDASLVVITNATPSITVLGVDGSGVQAPAAPALITTHASATAPAAPADTFDSLSLVAGLSPFDVVQRSTVASGFLASCPAGSGDCRAHGVITASSGRRAVAARRVILGSATALLRPGARTVLRVLLTRSGLAFLREHRAVAVEITVVVRSAGTVFARASRPLVLVERRPRQIVRPRPRPVGADRDVLGGAAPAA